MSIYNKFKLSNPITLYNGDCIELLQQIPSESVDLVITRIVIRKWNALPLISSAMQQYSKLPSSEG